ncbi:DUF3987 domain-containing protein [Streptomyces sp. NPDC002644]
MSEFDAMAYGPLGEAVKAVAPQTEADPIGIYAAGLSLYSGSVNKGANGGATMLGGRPLVIWTTLVGETGDGGKGKAYRDAKAILDPAIGRFLDSRIVGGISTGQALVTALAEYEEETKGSEGGTDGRIIMVDQEWMEILKRQRSCRTFSTKMRVAWDGDTIRHRTMRLDMEIARPCVGFHTHITPTEWVDNIKPSDAAGGSYNRILPVRVELARILPYGHQTEYPDVPKLVSAYEWAMRKNRVITLSREAGAFYDKVRVETLTRIKELPPAISCFMARSAEQTARIACTLAATEKKTTVPVEAMEAAWAFVQYSMRTVEELARQSANGAKTGRPVKTLPDRIREILGQYGGSVSRGTLTNRVGRRMASAEEITAALESMPDIRVVKGKSTGGAPGSTVMLIDPDEHTGQDDRQDVEPKEVPMSPSVITRAATRPKKVKRTPAKERDLLSELLAVR